MKINTIGNNFTNNVEKAKVMPIAGGNIAAKGVGVSVKISISEEGKTFYRNSLKYKSQDFDNVVEQRNELLSGKNTPATDYSFELGNKLADLKEKGVYKSTKDKASDLLKAYASVYDEIVQGYESGNRERYAEEQLSESGYRKLTMSEEIDSLNAAYKKYADGLEVQSQQKPKMIAAYNNYMEKISKIDTKKAKLAAEAQDFYAKIKDESVPENISEKVVAASKLFVEQYTKQNLNSMGIKGILQNIKIFEG